MKKFDLQNCRGASGKGQIIGKLILGRTELNF